MAVKRDANRKLAPVIVRDGLRDLILSGSLAAGQQLKQDEIASRFGTSRIPVREAMRQLESEGLIDFHPNRGAVVKDISLDDVLEMLDIRIALECRALKLAIPNMAIEDFEAAQAILDEYSNSPAPETWGEMNWRFHWALYLPSNRNKLLAMIESNYGHVSRFVRTQVSLATGKVGPQREHEELLRLCRENNVSEAIALLERHIEQTQKSLRSVIRRMEAAQ